MIELTDGTAVERLLRRVLAAPRRCRALYLCSPYIDGWTVNLLLSLAELVPRHGGSMTIATTTSEACKLRVALSTVGMTSLRIVGWPRLHAKVYVLQCRDSAESEAIVSSANLTQHAFRTNTEFGVRAVPTSPAGKLLFEQTLREMTYGGRAAQGRST